jgi:hypothetical protein
MLILALAALAATPDEFRFPIGTLPAARSTVDHVAVVIVDPGYGPEPREQRREIARSGSWMREVVGSAVSHHDFATGTSVTHWRDDASGNRGFSISRHASDDGYHLYRRVRTEEQDHALGEDCAVWRSERVNAQPNQEPRYLTCETADGIQLWSRTLSSSGSELGSSRTVSFARRHVSTAEVRPPRHLLRWRSWRDLAPAVEGPAPASAQPRDYEVRLSGGQGREQARIMRASRGWTYHESRGSTRRTISIRNDAIAIDYSDEQDGRPVTLAVRRLTAAERPSVRPPVPDQPFTPPLERVIGELCSWAQATGGEVTVTSGHHGRCATRDGLPLRIVSEHRGLIADLTATYIARRQLPVSALEPPRSAFSWAAWNIVPAD